MTNNSGRMFSEQRIRGGLRMMFFLSFGMSCLLSPSVNAQNLGSPANYNVTVSGSTVTTTQVYSNAYIDATALVGSLTDFCSILNAALSQLSTYPSNGGVIDARGVQPGPTSQGGLNLKACTVSPWSSISTPAVVLLPPGTILTQVPWVLPPGARLIGEGGEDPGSPTDSSVTRTIIQACSSATQTNCTAKFSGSQIVKMTGSACTGGFGVSIEDLVLDGNSLAIDGVDNINCQEHSYVKHVTIYRALDIGISVSSTAQNSGPYSNITFDLDTQTPTSSTYCAYIQATTRGIQKITCTTGATGVTGYDTGTNAIWLASGATNNTVEDVRIEGFAVGVYVGASSVVVKNVDGDTNWRGGSAPAVYVVEIGSGVANVALIGVSNNCTVNCSSAYSINDTPEGQTLKDQFVAMYALGNALAGTTNVYSRFTTSPSLASWSVGTAVPNTTTYTCPAKGSLYANMAPGSGPVLYVCSAYTGHWYGVD